MAILIGMAGKAAHDAFGLWTFRLPARELTTFAGRWTSTLG